MPEKRSSKKLKGTKHKAKVRARAKAAPPSAKKRGGSGSQPKKHTAGAEKGALLVFDAAGKTHEKFELDSIFTDGAVHNDVIYQAVLMYRAGEREGTAATKTRGEVRGGGKKPWKQKGTGQARHGSRRSPIWRGGGATFGPHPRDYSYSIPAEIRRRAVVEGVKDKVMNGKLFMLNKLELAAPKTKHVAAVLKNLKLERPLFLVEKRDNNLTIASRNIHGVSVKTADEVNALDVASHRECVITKGAYTGLLKRLKS